jgi:hypothetical protein
MRNPLAEPVKLGQAPSGIGRDLGKIAEALRSVPVGIRQRRPAARPLVQRACPTPLPAQHRRRKRANTNTPTPAHYQRQSKVVVSTPNRIRTGDLLRERQAS